MRMRTWALVLIICLLAGLPGRAAASTTRFSDMHGHWAADLVSGAAAAGYVHGYPDGTFRPDAPVTRAEAVKLVLSAGRVALVTVQGEPTSAFGDTPDDHWVVKQRYLGTALSRDIVPLEEFFRPDDPATRLEVLQFTLRMLNAPYADPPVPAEPPAFTDVPSAEDWRWIHAGVELGLVQGYPDGTFRPDKPVTRAEAVAIAERAAAWMTRGTDPNLRLVVNGKPVPEAELALRDGLIYAPAAAVYHEGFDVVSWHDVVGPRVGAFAQNELFGYCGYVATFEAGQRSVKALDGDRVPDLAALPYVRFDRLMIPVAPAGGSGTLPYAEAVHDPDTGTVTITFTADWPGYRLPTDPSGVRLTVRGPAELDPLLKPSSWAAPVHLTDEQGRCLEARRRMPVTYSVDPGDPIRLRGADGQLVTTYTTVPTNSYGPPQVVVAADNPPEGTYLVHITTDYGSGEQQVTVTDRGPRRLVLETGGPLRVGREATVQILTVDWYDRPTAYGIANYPGGSFPDPLRVIGPDGAAVEVQPHLYDMGTYDFVLVGGKGSFTFTPETPGTYRVLIPWRNPWSGASGQVDGYLEGTFEVNP